MEASSILIIADDDQLDAYTALSFPGEHIDYCPISDWREAAEQPSPDLVILDSGFFPELGLEILSVLKDIHRAAPILFLTDISTEETVIKAFKSGARDYFRKPVNTDELLETVDQIVKLKRAATEKRRSLSPSGKGSPFKLSRPFAIKLPENMLRSITFIEKNLSRPIYLEELAHEANLSKFHYCRIFKKYMGMSPMHFITLNRINKAIKLLRKETLTIAAVAIRSGFNDQSEFIRQFKKITGQTPAIYRNSLKAVDSFPERTVNSQPSEQMQ